MPIRSGVERLSFADKDGKVLPYKDSSAYNCIASVNNAPHLGNIVGSVLPADVYARYSRSRNRPTLYICGTDEYGTASETSALEANMTPRQLCDIYHDVHKKSYEWFKIGFDHFGRTTKPKQTEITQSIFHKLYNNNYFEPHTMEQPYCTKDKRFLSDRFVEGTCPICGYEDCRGDQCDKCTSSIDASTLIKPRCKICGSTPENRSSCQLALRLDLLQERIEPWVENAMQSGQFSNNCQAITKSELKKGLRPRDMTRDLTWGVPVPLEDWKDKVFYVWFDAPMGYISITAEYTDEWEHWWKDPKEVKLYQFMGKDNVAFHALYFPGYLIGTNEEWTLLNSLSTSEYLQYEGEKFSKSRNYGVFGTNAQDSGIPADVWRYYLIANRPETQDSSFSWDDFISRSNTELVNKLGNFVNRVIKFINAKYDSVLPASNNNFNEKDETFIIDTNRLITSFTDDMESIRLRASISTAFALAASGNSYLQSNKFGNDLLANDPDRCAVVISVAVNIIYLLSVVLDPFIPETSEKILKQLNAHPRSLPTEFSIDILPGHKINEAEHLFKRIDPSLIAELRAKYQGNNSS